MIPPKLDRPPRGRAGVSAREHDSWHANKFVPVLAGIGPDYIVRGFPFALFRVGTDYRRTSLQMASIIAHLQSFKCEVNDFMCSQPTPLRGGAA